MRHRTHPATDDEALLAALSAPALATRWLERRAWLRRCPSPEARELFEATERELAWRRGVSAC